MTNRVGSCDHEEEARGATSAPFSALRSPPLSARRSRERRVAGERRRSALAQVRLEGPHDAAQARILTQEALDLAQMQDAASRFVGFHDFKSFSDADPRDGSTEVLLETLDIRDDGDLIVFRVDGSHFIWKLVRRLVGVIVEVGRGGLTPDEAEALLSSDSGLPARLTAPASGLFLVSVRYKGDPPDQGRLLLGGVTPFSRR